MMQRGDMLGQIKECLLALGVSPSRGTKRAGGGVEAFSPELRFFVLNARAIVAAAAPLLS